MDLVIKDSPSTTEIIISGNIKSVSDNDSIKSAIVKAWNSDDTKPLSIKIDDSFIITSSVIGFLIKFIKKDKIPITLHVKNEELYEMLDDMNLIEALNVRR